LIRKPIFTIKLRIIVIRRDNRWVILDNRISLLRETNTTLEAIAQTLFKSWFVDFDPVKAKAEGRLPEGMDEATAALFPSEFEESALGLIPKGWRVGTLGDVSEE
jgi:type I restriction enzyme S subunit